MQGYDNIDQFDFALQRSKNFQRQISAADPITAKQLLETWREVIIEQFLEAIKIDDLEHLNLLDIHPALVISIRLKRLRPEYPTGQKSGN
jgi:hypothetical protein